LPASILIIDDDHAVSRLLQLTLGLEGHAVKHCPSPAEGLAAAKAATPDLVITDVLMPGYEAADFINDLRALGFDGPIVACTGLDGDIDLPVNTILRKPFDPDDLVEIVNGLLASRQS